MAVAIYLGSTSLIHYVVAPSLPAKKKAAPTNIQQPPANAARFRSLFDAGNQDLSDGRYASAVDNFLEAERSVDRLTDEQYAALKQARLRIAQIYESSGDSSAANSVYRAVADCGSRDGKALLQAKNLEGALARAQDAEQFSDRLSAGKRDSLQESTSLLVSALIGLHRYGQAVDAQQHWIDFLKTSADDYDQAFLQAYMMLEGIYGDSGDQHGVEQTLNETIESCDRIHDHFAAANVPFIDPTVQRNWSQYNLVIAYYREGNTDTALSRAEDFYAELSQKEQQQDAAHPLNVAYHASDFAAVALQIATEAKRQNEADFWQKRAPGGIKIISLQPPVTH